MWSGRGGGDGDEGVVGRTIVRTRRDVYRVVQLLVHLVYTCVCSFYLLCGSDVGPDVLNFLSFWMAAHLDD